MIPSQAKVLSYGDVVLRKADVATLADRCWINDQIIAFYFELLGNEQQVFKLLAGATTFLLLNTPPADLPAIANMLGVCMLCVCAGCASQNVFR